MYLNFAAWLIVKRERLKDFTERAIEASEIDALVPPIVYLPQRFRQNNQRLTLDNVRITIEPPTIKENHLRIAKADPLGLLIALMQGQPIPTFTVTPQGSILVKYEVADLRTRERIARWLGHKVTIATGKGPGDDSQEWTDMVDARAKDQESSQGKLAPGPGRPEGS